MRLHSYDNHGRLTSTVDSLTVPSLSAQYDFQRVQAFDLSGNVQWRGERELDAIASENKYDQGVEQVLIEARGMRKNGGDLLNQINSVAPSRENYESAKAKGLEILKSIGYDIRSP